MADVKRVYTFGNKAAEGNGKMRELLGGKGANLAEMNLIGIPVPPGFTITTEVCTEYYAHGKDKVIELLRPDAGYDGYDSEPRHERRGRRGCGQAHGQSAFCMGFLPPLRTDVRRRGAGYEAPDEGGSRSVRGAHRGAEGQTRREAGYRTDDRRSERTGRCVQGRR